MFSDGNSGRCPICGERYQDGFLSYCSGSVWHPKKPSGLGRIFMSAFPTGQRVFGSFLCSPFVSSVSAQRCPNCSSVLIPGKQ
jgi:hypothetical protein